MDNLYHRSLKLLEVLNSHVPKNYTLLEIGSGDNRNIDCLKANGYKNVIGIDKKSNTPIESYSEKKFDVIYTMSTLFLIKDESVFPKIARMAKKYLITIEGETSKGNGVIGRDYNEVFNKLGFIQIEHEENVFNQYGVLRVFKKI